MLPWLVAKQETKEPLHIVEFEGAMDKAFGNPDARQKALVQVNTMKQGTKDPREFLGKFDEALSDAGGLLWHDKQKKAVLETAISWQLLQGMIGVTPALVQSCVRGVQVDLKHPFDWYQFERKSMNSPPFVVNALLDRVASACTLIDSGCLSYGIISKRFAQRHCLTTFLISPRPVRGATGKTKYIMQIVGTSIDIGTYMEGNVFFYVLPDHLGYNLILGLPWLR